MSRCTRVSRTRRDWQQYYATNSISRKRKHSFSRRDYCNSRSLLSISPTCTFWGYIAFRTLWLKPKVIRHILSICPLCLCIWILVNQFRTWSDYISNITFKISRNLGILSRITYVLHVPQHIRRNVYYTMIHPYMYIPYYYIVWPITTLLSYLNYTPYTIVLIALYLDPLADCLLTRCKNRQIFL